MEGVKTPSEQCRGTLEQDNESTVAQIGPWEEQAPQPGVAYTHVSTFPVKGLKQEEGEMINGPKLPDSKCWQQFTPS